MRPATVISTSISTSTTQVQGFVYGYDPDADTFTCGGVPVKDDFMLRYRLMPYLRMYYHGGLAPRHRSATNCLRTENTDG